eukprot:8200082-Karenia_brevis.AAC.1
MHPPIDLHPLAQERALRLLAKSQARVSSLVPGDPPRILQGDDDKGDCDSDGDGDDDDDDDDDD